MRRIALVALVLAGCAPALTYNQSFLVPEQVKLAPNGYASLKSTGESFDLGPIRAQESKADRVEILKVHGTYLLVGDGYQHAWKLWPGGKDQMHYKPVKLEPGERGFSQPVLEASGNCALLKWRKGASPAQAYVNSDGDVNETTCPQ
jgi:hypothetical protein